MAAAEIETIFRDEAGRALATLIRLVGDFDLAEDALQDAFAAALERWSMSGVTRRSTASGAASRFAASRTSWRMTCCSVRRRRARPMTRCSTTTCCG
jgi:predicted RNA polymerase sigma factor